MESFVFENEEIFGNTKNRKWFKEIKKAKKKLNETKLKRPTDHASRCPVCEESNHCLFKDRLWKAGRQAVFNLFSHKQISSKKKIKLK